MRIGQRLLFVVIVVTCFVLLGPVGVGTNSLIGQEVRFASSPLIASITFAKTIGHERGSNWRLFS